MSNELKRAFSITDFGFYPPTATYFLKLTGDIWTRAGIDAYLPKVSGIKASTIIARIGATKRNPRRPKTRFNAGRYAP